MLGHRSALRDVIARYAVHVDDAPLSRLDKKINKLSATIAKVAQLSAVAFAAASYGAFQLAQAASSAEEAFEGLGAVLGKSGQLSVREWAKGIAKEMSRSEFAIEKSVFDFAKFLSPQLKDKGLTQGWAQTMSKLTIDLASFNDVSDSEAQMRLFSGVSGETEAVRRLGIDISDTALDNLNKSKGGTQGGKRMASLTLAEKTLLRMEKIMIDSKNAQGDAVRTANRWAGVLKRVQAQMHRMAVVLGRRIIPLALKLLEKFDGLLKKTDEWLSILLDKTSTVKTVLLMAGTAAAALAMHFLVLAGSSAKFVATMSEYAKYAGPIGKIAAAFLIIEDILTFFDNRNNGSFMGAALEAITGVQRPLDLVQMVFERISIYAHNTWQYLKHAAAVLTAMATADVHGGKMLIRKGPDTIDADQLQTGRMFQREADFRSAVRDGNIEEAVANFARVGEDNTTGGTGNPVYRRAVEMRKHMIKVGEVAGNKRDADSGFIPNAGFEGPTGRYKEFDPEATKVNGPMLSHPNAWRTLANPDAPVMLNITNKYEINGGDPKAIQTTLEDSGKKNLRQAQQALKRSKGGN